jgi:hypothetical protein
VPSSRPRAELAEQLADAERQRFALGDSTILIVNVREDAAADVAAARVEYHEARHQLGSLAARGAVNRERV